MFIETVPLSCDTSNDKPSLFMCALIIQGQPRFVFHFQPLSLSGLRGRQPMRVWEWAAVARPQP